MREVNDLPKLLVIGLNDNLSGEENLSAVPVSRDGYSEYFRDKIKVEIKAGRPQYISNLIPPIADFLFGKKEDKDRQDFQCQALDVIEFCNVISCCPSPTSDGKPLSASTPSAKMRQNCGKRLESQEGEVGHELLSRLLKFKPTHVLILGRAAEHVWKKARREKVLSAVLREISTPEPKEVFVYHPSQRTLSREKYRSSVYEALKTA